MKNKNIWIAVALVVLIGGASVLYRSLSRGNAPEQLRVEGAAQTEAVETKQSMENAQSTGSTESIENTENTPAETSKSAESTQTEPAQSAEDTQTAEGQDVIAPREESTEAQASAAERSPAPDFTVQDAEGNPVKLSDFVGKPVVLNFWASWCGPCKSEMPEFDQVQAELGEEVQFLMVNLTDGSRETVATASKYIEDQGFSFKVLYDTAGEGAGTYGLYSIPSTYFIDAEGNAAAQATGAIDRNTLLRGIEMIHSQQ